MVTTAALALLIVVLLVAAYARLWMAIVTAVVAMLTFNFFFLAPVGTLTIADPHNLVAFIAFVSAALIVSQLSSGPARAGKRSPAATSWRLCDLSRDVRAGESAKTPSAASQATSRAGFNCVGALLCGPAEWARTRAEKCRSLSRTPTWVSGKSR